VHLAIDPLDLPVGVEHSGGVVIQPGGAALEQRRHDYDAVLLRNLAERFRGRTGDRFGEIE